MSSPSPCADGLFLVSSYMLRRSATTPNHRPRTGQWGWGRGKAGWEISPSPSSMPTGRSRRSNRRRRLGFRKVGRPHGDEPLGGAKCSPRCQGPRPLLPYTVRTCTLYHPFSAYRASVSFARALGRGTEGTKWAGVGVSRHPGPSVPLSPPFFKDTCWPRATERGPAAAIHRPWPGKGVRQLASLGGQTTNYRALDRVA